MKHLTPISNHFGKFLRSELEKMSQAELVNLIYNKQNEDKNFIVMSDSYKMTHHLLLPEGIEEAYSYMESRGGEMEYTIFILMQYYLIKYFAGVVVTQENIEEAHELSIKHFGKDCFNRALWDHILNDCGGKLPLEIKAVKEGTKVPSKNVLFSIRNTTKKSAPLTNIAETLLMKLWAPCTVAAYSRHIYELILKYAKETSTNPLDICRFLIHDFGYRGVSSEESAAILGAAHLAVGNLGTDTVAAIRLLRQFYDADMPGYSVVASEHFVACAFGRENEIDYYRNAIKHHPTGILSLVSDTYNIYNVCRTILPTLKESILERDGKLVIRPDSGDPIKVLFGYDENEITADMIGRIFLKNQDGSVGREISYDESIGVYGILFEEFGYDTNELGYRTLNPKIGVLQGDGISLISIGKILEKMKSLKIDTTQLVFGSGGKLLQAHDRDEQKFAIKATFVKINGKGLDIQKDPFTDPGKKSKKGYLKLVEIDGVLKLSKLMILINIKNMMIY